MKFNVFNLLKNEHKSNIANDANRNLSLNQSAKEDDIDWSSVKFPIIDPSTRAHGRGGIAKTGVYHAPEKPGTDYSNNNYHVIRQETRNMNNEVVDTYFFVYRVYSTGGKKRISNKAEIDWAVSRTFNQ